MQYIQVFASQSNDDECGVSATYVDGVNQGLVRDTPRWVSYKDRHIFPLYRYSDRLMAGEANLIELSITSEQPLDADLCHSMLELVVPIAQSDQSITHHDNSSLLQALFEHPYGKNFSLTIQF